MGSILSLKSNSSSQSANSSCSESDEPTEVGPATINLMLQLKMLRLVATLHGLQGNGNESGDQSERESSVDTDMCRLSAKCVSVPSHTLSSRRIKRAFLS